MGHLLSASFGNRFQTDNSSDPANPLSIRNVDPRSYFATSLEFPAHLSCIHGHFHPGKYQIGKDVLLFTLLRHPVDNIISIYSYWKTASKSANPLHHIFLREEMDIIRMAQMPLLRFLYSHTYFGQFDMARFDIIGRHETRADALSRLSTSLDTVFEDDQHLNQTQPTGEKQEIINSKIIRERLTEILERDVIFYEKYARY